MPKSHRILVTGSAGRLGSIAALELLENGHYVRGFDVNPSDASIKDCLVANLTDRAAVSKSVEGMDTVIHLGATPDNQDFLSLILPNNLEGLYNVIEASRAAGVKRLILASSMQVVDRSIEPNHTIKLGDPYTPNNPYACAKVFAEMLGQMYAVNHPITVMSVRIGWSPRDLAGAQKLARSKKGVISYFSHRDAARFFRLAVEKENLPSYSVVFAASKSPTTPAFDLEPARQLLGYEPQDVFPEGLDFEFVSPRPAAANQ